MIPCCYGCGFDAKSKGGLTTHENACRKRQPPTVRLCKNQVMSRQTPQSWPYKGYLRWPCLKVEGHSERCQPTISSSPWPKEMERTEYESCVNREYAYGVEV